jgi:RimJ/RimL family protein N-acetyltransferase
MLDILIWRNDQETRNNSISGNKAVTLQEHEKWFNTRNKDKKDLFIAQIDNLKIGVLRLEDYLDGYEIGVNVRPELRGLGLGYIMVNEFMTYKKPSLPTYARIKHDNYISQRLFIKCCFEIIERKENYILMRHW